MQPPRSLGIVGHGDFGRFLEMLARRFAPGLPVLVFARKAAPDGSRSWSEPTRRRNARICCRVSRSRACIASTSLGDPWPPVEGVAFVA